MPPKLAVSLLVVTVTVSAGLVARADWSVRRNATDHATLLLRALDRAPDDVPALQTLVDEVGIARALTLATRRAASTGTWQAHFVVGRLEMRKGRVGRAVAAFSRSLRVAPRQQGAADALLGWIGEQLIQGGRPRQALRLLKRWVGKRPHDALAREVLARIALERRDTKTAVKYQRQLVKLRPKDVQLRLVYARMLKQAGELDDAIKVYGETLKLDPKDGSLKCQVLTELGQLQELVEQFDAAVESYRRALKLATEGGYVHRQLEERILRNFVRRRAHAKLEAEAKRILAKRPKHRLALRLLAEQLSRRPGKLSEAIAIYERYLKVVPSDSKARETLMFMLVGTGRTKQAVPHARALYKSNPAESRRLLEYAGLLSLTGDQKGAKTALREGIPRFAKDPDALQMIYTTLDRLGDRRGASLALDALLKTGKRSESVLVKLGRTLWSKGRYEQALKVWRSQLGNTPTRLAYEQWAELLLSVRATRVTSLRGQVNLEVRRGLERFPRHRVLLLLKRRLARP
jgi:tetratricopeptide (TPR) repeat protein